MFFLNVIMLAGLALVAVPILIHLLNRSRARIVDWGAMRFLEASLASRSRRIMIEEVILLVLRCLVVALAALALARPYLPTRPTVLWVLFAPAVLGAAICGSLAAAMWASRKARRILLAAAIVLLAVPALAAALEHAHQSRRWSFGGGEKDVALVLDASTSMQLKSEGKTNFQRAVAEARAVLASCRQGDGICLILAGPAPRAVIGSPTSDRKEAEAALGDVAPTGGSMRVHRALQMASHALAEGSNPAKKIVLITDGQQVGWDVQKASQWKFLGGALKGHPTPPHIVVRTLPLPKKFRNVTVSEIAIGRRVVGTDRDVRIDVKVASTGTEPTEPKVVELRIDGEKVASEAIERVLPNAAETVHFEHRFRRPGRHIVAARVVCEDDLPADNADQRVIDVLEALPVLIGDGAPSTRPLEGAADFVEVALAPPAKDDEPGGRPDPPAKKRPDEACLVVPEVVPAPDVAKVQDLSRYAVVVLAEVSLLPTAFATELDRFVRGGGGLLVAPGAHAQAKFYGAWRSESGQLVLPGRLTKLRPLAEKPAHLAADTFSHPALDAVADPSQSDVRLTLISLYWQVEVDEKDAAVSVAAQLESGDPALVERKLGKGRVLLATMALHPRGCNLPALKCFVPMMHEIAYYLARPTMVECNVASGSDLTVELRALRRGGAGEGTGLKAEYFRGTDLRPAALKFTRVDPTVHFDWAEGAPHQAVGQDNFSVRWTGRLKPRYSDTYTFLTTSDDGIRLWVNGRKIIDNWAAHSVEERRGTIRLEADRPAEIKLEYFDSASLAVAKLEWSSRRQKREVIPAARLYPEPGAVAGGALARGDKVEIVTPSQRRRLGTVARSKDPLRVAFQETHEPGLYRMVLPQAALAAYGGASPDGKGVPFVVLRQAAESTITPLTDADLATARGHVLETLEDADPAKTLVRVETTHELTASVAGGIPGHELWQWLALVLLGAILAEIALTRWIAVQRKVHMVQPVAFGAEAVDIQSFRRRARDLLATPEAQAEGASGARASS
jgi:hypothetical protein